MLDLVENNAALTSLLIDDLPYIKAEVLYSCHYEMAMTPYDILARRTSIILEDWRRGLGIVDEVASLMAQEHGWSLSQQRAHVAEYRAALQEQAVAQQRS